MFFTEEARMLVQRYGLKWHPEAETVENGFSHPPVLGTPRFSASHHPQLRDPGLRLATGVRTRNPAGVACL